VTTSELVFLIFLVGGGLPDILEDIMLKKQTLVFMYYTLLFILKIESSKRYLDALI